MRVLVFLLVVFVAVGQTPDPHGLLQKIAKMIEHVACEKLTDPNVEAQMEKAICERLDARDCAAFFKAAWYGAQSKCPGAPSLPKDIEKEIEKVACAGLTNTTLESEFSAAFCKVRLPRCEELFKAAWGNAEKKCPTLETDGPFPRGLPKNIAKVIERIACAKLGDPNAESKMEHDLCQRVDARDCGVFFKAVWYGAQSKCPGAPSLPRDIEKEIEKTACAGLTNATLESELQAAFCERIKGPGCDRLFKAVWNAAGKKCPTLKGSHGLPDKIAKMIEHMACAKLTDDKAKAQMEKAICERVNDPDCAVFFEVVWYSAQSKCPGAPSLPKDIEKEIQKVACAGLGNTTLESEIAGAFCHKLRLPQCEVLFKAAWDNAEKECLPLSAVLV